MLYRYHIIPRSPLCTELMSDTIFGHFCWALSYEKGESFLKSFLESFDNNEPAPVLFSSAFISDMLPRPCLPPSSRHEISEFVKRNFGNSKKDFLQGMTAVKKWNKKKFITLAHWSKIKDKYSDIKLYELLYNDYLTKKETDKKENLIHEIFVSNSINRINGQVHEGGLFHREKNWYNSSVTFDLYIEINNTLYKPLVDWFLTHYLPLNGFGADKSTGMGHLSIIPDEKFDHKKFSLDNGSCRLSLSLASFPEMNKLNSFYRLKPKFGKLGGSYSCFSPGGGNPRPFKKPLLMYEPGAVFFCKDTLSRKRLLKDVHPDPSIRHCGIPLTVPFTLKEDLNYDTETS